MDRKTFDSVVDTRLIACLETLGSKNREYNPTEDKLGNFKRSAALVGSTAASECAAFMRKHIVSVMDLANDPPLNAEKLAHLIKEKIGDLINYALLLECCLIESNYELQQQAIAVSSLKGAEALKSAVGIGTTLKADVFFDSAKKHNVENFDNRTRGHSPEPDLSYLNFTVPPANTENAAGSTGKESVPGLKQ